MRKTLTRLVFAALFAALISAGAFAVIPVGAVPIVLQNFFALLSGLVLGPVLGPAAVGLFIAAGAAGIPVFTAGSPMGIARLIGPTGGFMLGYLFSAAVAGLIAGFPRPGVKTPLWRLILASVAGMLIVYVPGLLRLHHFVGSWSGTFAAGLFPFLIGDAIKCVIAVLIAPRLRRVASQFI